MITRTDRLVLALLRELRERRGFDSWWDGIDCSIKAEIEKAMALIIDDFNEAHGIGTLDKD